MGAIACCQSTKPIEKQQIKYIFQEPKKNQKPEPVIQEYMKNLEIQLSSDIVFSISQLNEHLELNNVSEEYKSFLQSLNQQQEEKVEYLKEILQSFYQSQNPDQIQINQIINLIIQVIHFYLMIELNKTYFDKYNICFSNNLNQILQQLNDDIVTNIEKQFKNSNDLSFKFLQTSKLSNIIHNQKFQALIQVIKKVFQNDIQEIIKYPTTILVNMKENLNKIQQNLSNRIQDIFENQMIIEKETISILLNDISWINQNNNHYKELIINDNWLKLETIQKSFNDIICELEQQIQYINQEQPQTSDQESMSIKNNLKKIKEKYDFIKLICQQYEFFQQNKAIINKAIENKINQIIETGKQNLNVEVFTQNQSIIQTLINLDQEIENKIKQNQNYITYEQSINNQFKDQINNISKNLFWEQEEREKQTQGQNTWEYSLNNLKLDQNEKFSLQDLKSQCDLFDMEFNATNKQIAEGSLNNKDLTKRIFDMAKEFKSQNNYLLNKKIKWNTKQKTQILKILAYLSAVWTFMDMKSTNFSEYQKQITKRMQSNQILAIMRLLNIDQSQCSKIINQAVQVQNGEGKSIVIGITSTIYALLGFQIDCCCYSAILSERDYNDFKPIFIHFGVESQIQYNTFGNLAEKIINNEYDLRKQGEAFLNQKSQQLPKDQPKQETNKILIIVELDFFFGENFFGEVYSIGCQYSNQEIINLFKLIWKKKYRHFSIQGVKQSQEYQELFKQHPYLESLKQQIDNKIKQMIIDARQMENHSYILGPRKNSIENSIGYKELDSINYDTVKGFKTGFAHLLEWQRKKISTELMKKKLSFTFSLGSFSYLKMIESYSIILGVTGTLENMSKFQKNQMRNIYKIKKLTYTPSIFGQSKFSFDKSKNTHVFQKKEDYFQKIYDETLLKIQNKRAVIIFFENNQILFEFYEKYMQDKNKDCQILIESSSNKEAIIARASSSGMITLSTKLFGRGIDYKCFSKIVVDNGGIHCIQTFFSKTEAEQIQIQGSVARIGSTGSYCLIILQKHLMEQFNLNERLFPSPNQVVTYELLEKIRNSNLEKTEKNLLLKQKESEKYHKVSLKLKKLLLNTIKNKGEIYKTLKKISVFADSKDIRVGSSDSSDLANNKNEGQIGSQHQENDENKFIHLGERVQFQNVSVLVGQFCQHHWFLKSDLQTLLQRSLDVVGVKMIKVVYDEQEFINEISNFDQVWIISHTEFKNTSPNIEKRFSQAILEHLEKKKGLMLLADNDPFFYHANLILKSIPIGYEEQQPKYMKLIGNDRADNQLKKGAYNKELQFGEHTLTNSLKVMFEGSTICYPKVINEKNEDSYDDFYDVDIIGTSQTSRPCIFALNGNNSRGRIAFDCGFTKMHQYYWHKTPGTEIYFQNCYQWLCNLDNQDN